MQSENVDYQQIKERMRSTWMAGDFGQIALYSAKGADEFVERLNILPEMRMLDVACGTGNLAIPAARKGAQVTGVDIASNLLEQARSRAEDEGLRITFEEGDAEQLPYPDASFDLVMSMFGAMFAPRPEYVSEELMRVCRPGGIVAMANWTPEGFVGKTFSLTARYAPPPHGIPAPVLWGDEQTVRQRLGGKASQITTDRRKLVFEYPFPPKDVVQFFRQYFGPTKAAFGRLDESMQAAYSADLEQLWSEHNLAQDGTTLIDNEYLEVIAIRA
jgi:ubiquinone/menaquinone biosynthesis C-methylase UbiE